MKKSLLTIALVAVVALVLVPSAAMADTLTFTLNQDGCGGGCLNFANASAGNVLLTQNGNNVDVLVTLNASFGFIDTGTHETFTFSINGNPSITNLTPGFTWGTPGTSNPPFGTFGVFSNCGTTCGNGASAPYYGTLGFTVSLLSGNLSINDFVGNSNTPPIFFAADLFSNNKNGGTGTGNTGAVGALGPNTSTPEPASIALLSAGLIGLGGLVRRRKQ